MKLGSIKDYNSALFNLSKIHMNHQTIQCTSNSQWNWTTHRLDIFFRPPLDISPVLNLFRKWNPSPNLSSRQLNS
ncbi:hypothetical protein AYI69_g8983 [Smittium culicis]|uniref:Uncharacterized protein n=1 Tax=Smittium culicis TaxID=133412 RepID=A0A1R1XFT9_9FUNG|nr:hypothetical protein AYI69_g8983 [Smittium culicis]